MEDIIPCCVLSVDKRERNNIIKQDSRNFFTGSSTFNSSFTEEYQGDLRNSFRFVFSRSCIFRLKLNKMKTKPAELPFRLTHYIKKTTWLLVVDSLVATSILTLRFKNEMRSQAT